MYPLMLSEARLVVAPRTPVVYTHALKKRAQLFTGFSTFSSWTSKNTHLTSFTATNGAQT